MPSICSRVGLALLAAAVLGVGTACTSTPSAFKAGSETSVINWQDARSAGLRQRWHRYVGLSPEDRVSNIWRVGDRLYVVTQKNELIALDASAGTIAWHGAIEGAATKVTRPVELPGNQVLVVNRANAFLFDGATGRKIANRPLGFSVSTDPVISGNIIGIGGPNFFYGLYADLLRGVEGENAGSSSATVAPPPVLATNAKWITPAPNDFFGARPTVAGDNFLLATNQGILWKINAANGEWDWKDRKVNGGVVAPLSADGKAVYIPCLDQRLYAFDLLSGAHLWDARLEGRLEQQAVPVGNTILVVSESKGMYAVAADKGELKYNIPEVARVLGSVGDKAYASTNTNQLLMFNTETGEKVSTTNIQGEAYFVANNKTDGLIFVATIDGRIAAYEQMK